MLNKHTAVAFVMFVPSLLFAAPVINSVYGTFATDSLLTITGTGFGTKSPATPFLWDDFEGEWQNADSPGDRQAEADASSFTVADSAAIGGYDYVEPGIVYEETGAFSGSRSAFHQLNPAGQYTSGFSSKFSWDDMATNAQRCFVSFAVRLSDNTGSLVDPTAKLLRISTWYPNNSGDHKTGTIPSIWVGLPRDYSRLSYSAWADGASPGEQGGITDNMFDDPSDEWFTASLWGIVGGPGDHYGLHGHEFNGNIQEYDSSDFWTNGLECFAFRSFYFCGYWSETEYPAAVWFDEVYADTSLSRVTANDISQAGISGSSGGQTAMQIPVSWSDTEIQVIVNTGRYANDTELGLIVYDSDGNASAPFSVSVSAEIDEGEVASPGTPSCERDGPYRTYEWTPASPEPDHYVLALNDGDGWDWFLSLTDTTYTATTDSTKAYRARVSAFNSDGTRASRGGEGYDAAAVNPLD